MQSSSRDSTSLDVMKQFCDAVTDDLDMLARLHAEELSVEFIELLKAVDFPENLGFSLNDEHGQEAIRLMGDAVRELPIHPDTLLLDQLAADYSAIYLTHSCRAAPMESVWLDEEGLAFQQPMFQVRDWYKRYGLGVKDWRKRSDDHLVVQLQFAAFLFRRADDASVLDDIARFLDEHLLRWLIDFAERVAMRCDTAFYAGLCLLSAAYIENLRELLVLVTGKPRPSTEEIEERMKPVAQTADQVSAPYTPGVAPSW